MPKKFYLNNRNGERSSQVDELKNKHIICVAPLHVRIIYSFRIEKAVSQRLSWTLSHPEGAFSFLQKNTVSLTEGAYILSQKTQKNRSHKGAQRH